LSVFGKRVMVPFIVFKEKWWRQFQAMWDASATIYKKTCLIEIYGTLAVYATVKVAYAPLGFLQGYSLSKKHPSNKEFP